MDKAKLAIDMLEYIVSRTRDSMAEQERAEVDSMLHELKFVFMQSLGGTPADQPSE